MGPLIDSGLSESVGHGLSLGLQLLALRQRQEDAAREDELRRQQFGAQQDYHNQMAGVSRDRLNQDIAEWQAKQKAEEADRAGLSAFGHSFGNLASMAPAQPVVTGPSPDFGKPAPQPMGGPSIPFNQTWPKALQIDWAKEQLANSAAAQRRLDEHRFNLEQMKALPKEFRDVAETAYLSKMSPAEIQKIGTPKFDPMTYTAGMGKQMGPDGQPLYQPNELNEIARWAGGSKRELTPEEIHKARTAANMPPPEKLAGAMRTVHPNATLEAADAAVMLRGAGMPIGLGDANFSGDQRPTPLSLANDARYQSLRIDLDEAQDEQRAMDRRLEGASQAKRDEHKAEIEAIAARLKSARAGMRTRLAELDAMQHTGGSAKPAAGPAPGVSLKPAAAIAPPSATAGSATTDPETTAAIRARRELPGATDEQVAQRINEILSGRPEEPQAERGP